MNLCPIFKRKKKKIQNSHIPVLLPSFVCLSSSSSADLSQPVVCLGVGDDGLHGHDGLVDLGLQLSQLLDVQQAQDLSRLVQSRVWEEINFGAGRHHQRVTTSFFSPDSRTNSLTTGVETQRVFVQSDRDTLRNKEGRG